MRHRIEPDAKSLYVQMDITTRCNLRCVMCAREQNLPEGRDMAVGSFEMIARKVFDKAAVLNLSCGAEPLMSRHFEEILDVVKGYRIPRVEFVTNGILLDEGQARKLIACGVTSIEVSVDGACRETYERIRRGASWERLLANLARLKELKAEYGTRRPYVKLNFVMMCSNIEELPALVEMAKDLGTVEVAPQHLVVYKEAQIAQESLFSHQELADAMVVQARQVAARQGIIFREPPLFREERSRLARLRDRAMYGARVLGTYGLPRVLDLGSKLWRRRFVVGRTICPLPWEFVLIDPGGAVLPCSVWYGEEPMGNISQQSFEEIWYGGRYRRLRQELRGQHPLRSSCANCPSVASYRVEESAFQSVEA